MKLILTITVIAVAAIKFLPSQFVESSQVEVAMLKHHQMIAEVTK